MVLGVCMLGKKINVTAFTEQTREEDDLSLSRMSRNHNLFLCIKQTVKDHLEDVQMRSDEWTIIDGSTKLTGVEINMA